MYDELVKRLKNCATQAAPCLTCDMTDDGSCIETLMKQAADAIEELSRDLDSMNEANIALYGALPKWIPVAERLPRDRQFVLVYCGDNKRIRPSDRFDVAILLGDSIFTSLGVTHWMPLPQPPKEK